MRSDFSNPFESASTPSLFFHTLQCTAIEPKAHALTSTQPRWYSTTTLSNLYDFPHNWHPHTPSQSRLGSPPRPLLKEERNPRQRAFKSKCTKFAITWHRLVQKSQPAVIPASSSVVWVLLNAQVDAAWVCHSRGHKWEILCGGTCTLIFTFTLSSYTIFQPLETCFFPFLLGGKEFLWPGGKNTGRDTRLHSRGLHFFDVICRGIFFHSWPSFPPFFIFSRPLAKKKVDDGLDFCSYVAFLPYGFVQSTVNKIPARKNEIFRPPGTVRTTFPVEGNSFVFFYCRTGHSHLGGAWRAARFEWNKNGLKWLLLQLEMGHLKWRVQF